MNRDLLSIAGGYVACITIGIAVLIVADLPPLWNALAADLAATLVIFGFSRWHKNSSFYDAYWSVIPPLLAAYWMISLPGAAAEPRSWIVLVLVCIWATRLTWNWAAHWPGMSHEDWRYIQLREQAGKAAILVDFFGIHLFPTIQVFLGCLPIYFIMQLGQGAPGLFDGIAIAVIIAAILIETIADIQLHRFLRERRPGQHLDSGLWGWSRHPNYFGELLFWCGLMLLGLAAVPQLWYWQILGALAMTLMMVFASVPLMDKRSLDRRPGYDDYMRRVRSPLIPLPPK